MTRWYSLLAFGIWACATPTAPVETDASAAQEQRPESLAAPPPSEREVAPGSYASHLRAWRDAGAFRPRVSFESDAQASEFQRCGADSDCAIAGNGCCHEGVGDPGIGIRKDKLEAFAKLAPCSDGICSLVHVKRAAGAAARCVNTRCAYEGVY